MQRNRTICLDIGSHTIKAVVGIKSTDGVEVVDAVILPVQGVVCGVVVDIEKCTQSIKKVMYTLKAKETDTVLVGLSNYYVESAKSKQSKFINEGEKISDDDLDELYKNAENAYLKEELELIDVFLQYYNVDDLTGIQNPRGMQGIKIEAVYNIFSCRKALIANIEQCVNDAGFEVDEFIFSPYYTSKAIFSEEDKETGVLVIDLGSDITRSSLFVDGSLYSSFSLPLGSRSVTLDIKNSYPITLKQADSLKKQYSCALAELAEENAEVSFKSSDAWGGRSLKVSELAGVVQCRLDEIFRGIRYQLRKKSLEDAIETIILIGGGSQQNSIKESVEKKFQVPVRLASLNSELSIIPKNLSALTFANAIGMLHYKHDYEIEEKEEKGAGIMGRLRGLFGSKSSGKDTSM